MTVESLASRICSMEAQVEELKAQMEQLGAPPERSFADLYGVFSDMGDISEAEIDACLYGFDWIASGDEA